MIKEHIPNPAANGPQEPPEMGDDCTREQSPTMTQIMSEEDKELDT